MTDTKPFEPSAFWGNRERVVLFLDHVIEYGIYLLVIFQFPSTGESFRSIGLYAPLGAWLLKLWLIRESRKSLSTIALTFLIFIGSLFCAALLSSDRVTSLHGFWRIFLKSVIPFFVISYNFSTQEQRMRLSWVLACSGCVAVVAGVWNYVQGFTVDGGMAAFSYHRNTFAAILAYLIPFVIASAITGTRRVERCVFGGFFFCGVAAVLLTSSRGGWITLMVSLAVWAFCLRRLRLRVLLRTAVALIAIGLVALAISPDTIVLRIATFHEHALALNKRVPEIWVPILAAVKDRPLVGWGPSEAVIGRLYPTYYTRTRGTEHSPMYIGVHSFSLTILVYAGLIGLAAYVALVSTFLVRLLQQLRRAATWSERPLVIAVLTSFLSVYLVHGSIEGFILWMPFGVILGVGDAVCRTETADETTYGHATT